MRCLLFACLFLVLACNGVPEEAPAQEPLTGFYLEADTAGPNTVALAADSTGGTHYVDTTQLLDLQDFRYMNLRVSGKQAVLAIELTDMGRRRYEYVEHFYRGRRLALVLDGHFTGTWIIPHDTDEQYHPFEVEVVANPAWLKNAVDSLDALKIPAADLWEKHPPDTIMEVRYASGKIFRVGEYKANSLLWMKEYYENGTLAQDDTNLVDTVDGVPTTSFVKHYSPDGRLKWEEYHGNSGWVLVRSFYSNGQVSYDARDYQTPHNQPTHVRFFAPDGRLTYECRTQIFDGYPGDYQGEFNHPQVMHEQYFSDGKLTAEGDLYGGCGECTYDSAGTWKFYRDGQLIRTARFERWQSMHKQAITEALKTSK